MGSLHLKPHIILLSIFIFSSFSLLSLALTPAGTIERITKQQLITSIPPNHEPTPTGSSQLFLTSPSGKYGVFLIRHETSIGAGGFGSDFCYIQVQDSGISVWESECTPVSNLNTCSLMFTDGGLEIFDGSRSAWDGDVDGENLETLELLDKGDMTIRDKYGNQVWKASDNPVSNQNCGSIGSPGLAPVLPPFAAPIHGGRGPFGQQTSLVGNTDVVNQEQETKTSSALAPIGEDQGQESTISPGLEPVAVDEEQQNKQDQLEDPKVGSLNDQPGLVSGSLNQPFGGGSSQEQQQPLLDNTPFDSGFMIGGENAFKFAVFSTVLGCLGFLF